MVPWAGPSPWETVTYIDLGEPQDHIKSSNRVSGQEEGTLILTLAQAPPEVPRQCPQTGSPEGVSGHL